MPRRTAETRPGSGEEFILQRFPRDVVVGVHHLMSQRTKRLEHTLLVPHRVSPSGGQGFAHVLQPAPGRFVRR